MITTQAPQETRDLLRLALEEAYPGWVSVLQLHSRTGAPRSSIYQWLRIQRERGKVIRTQTSGIYYYRLRTGEGRP